MSRTNQVAVVGLGVMGANLARNLARHGFRVGGYSKTVEESKRVAAAHPEAALDVAASLPELVARLERPRKLILLVNAGPAVDAVLDGLDPLLEAGDLVVDAGNSLYTDTDRRLARAAGRPWSFVGMGLSGGAQGALEGPSLMPGGAPEAWAELRPMLEAIAARGSDGPTVAWCGHGSAGHFVKMVHNGIEYGDMQLISEAALLLRQGLSLSGAQVADTFAEWNQGELSSFLVEITADIFRTPDPERSGELLIDAILDQAGQKGTGRWTVIAAADLGVPIPTIAAAVDARNLSAGRALRSKAASVLGESRSPLTGVSPEHLRDALYASKIASYTQGFALLAAASAQHGFRTDPAEVARIWTAGCIIRASLLDRVRAAFRAEPHAGLLALSSAFAEELRRREGAWRRTVSAASASGYPIPGLGGSLAWYDTLRASRGTGALIQAQRDYFGSHTYERIESPGKVVHTEWPRLDGRG